MSVRTLLKKVEKQQVFPETKWKELPVKVSQTYIKTEKS